MTTFERFSEAGKLYSENYTLIEEMKKAYEADVMACILAIEEGLREGLPEREVSTTVSGKSRYWYLKSPTQYKAPQLWLSPLDRDYVDHEEVIVVCGMADNDPVKIAAVSAIAAEVGADPSKKPSMWYLFRVILPLTVDDPIANAVRILAPILPAAEKAYLEAQAKDA